MLVPVTSSLYVNGTVTKPDKVLVDIGTGYFVEVCAMSICFPIYFQSPKASRVGFGGLGLEGWVRGLDSYERLRKRLV